MADVQNARYRLLSFKYTPPLAKTVQAAGSKNLGKEAQSRLEDGEGLPLLSSFLTSLEEIEGADDAGNKNGSRVDLRQQSKAKKGKTSVPRTTPPSEFPFFNDLPLEIRLQILDFTFLPRVVEMRPFRSKRPGNNPTALVVSIEAREAALAHFRIPFPLAITAAKQRVSRTQQHTTIKDIPFQLHSSTYTGPPFGSAPFHADNDVTAQRVLYISLEHETVCLLGLDWDFERLANVTQTFRVVDPLRFGIGRLGPSVRAWGFGGSVVMKNFDTTLLQGLDQLVLFMYGEQYPPPTWWAKGSAMMDGEEREQYRREGIRCELIPCEYSSTWNAFRVWSAGQGRQFWDEDGRVLRIGRKSNEIRFMDLEFKAGW